MSDPMEAVRCLLKLSHRGRPEDLPSALTEAAPFLDAAELSVLLVDYEQLALWPLRGGAPWTGEPVTVDGTLAGRAFAGAEVTQEERADGTQVWLPLLHGAERLGVLVVRVKADPDDRLLDDLRMISALVA